MKVPYKIVVEPSEYEQYAAVIDKEKILVLPSNFSELKQGSIPVRNWVWQHSIDAGHAWHWIIDDNIYYFLRYNNNLRIKAITGTIFYAIEEFVLRYENVAIAGMNYKHFAVPDAKLEAITFNTRIYSNLLIRNDLPYRWRGRYNEDTDICLRALEDGWVTCLFNAFLADKQTTMKGKGGNTDTIYNTGDKRLEFAKSLERQHPHVVRVTQKFGRWHHHVNYKPFKGNLLKKKPGIVIKPGVDEFDFILKKRDE